MQKFNNYIGTFRSAFKLAFRIDKKLFLFLLAINALWGLLALPGFYLEKVLLDTLVSNIGNPLWQEIVWFIVLIISLRILLELVKNLVSRITRFIQDIFNEKIEVEADQLISGKLSELDIATLEDPDFKNKFHKIKREYHRLWKIFTPLADIPNYLIGFVSSIVALFLVSPLLPLFLIISTIPQILVQRKYSSEEYALRTSHGKSYKMWGWLSYYLIQNNNFLELKLLGISTVLSKKLKDIQTKINLDFYNLGKKREASAFASFLPLSAIELASAIWLSVLTITERITIGSFEFYMRNLRNAQTNLVSLNNSVMQLLESAKYVDDLFWFLSQKPKIVSPVDAVKIEGESINIRFDDVWFKYKKGQKSVVRGYSFEIKTGDKIAIVGENGAGKSTLLKLLARFYDPTKGSIFINNHNLKDIDLSDWHKSMSVLFQQFEDYPFSARDSIGYGDIERKEEFTDIRNAARKTNMDDYIMNLPKKYDTPLHADFEGGLRPSVGQVQRIGISRMLFRKNAKIVILDEPTSNVDPEAEENIFIELKELSKNKILLFVTQRFSTARIADKIMVVDKGKIIEFGTHKELMDLDGKYKRLYTLQAQAYHPQN